MKTLDSIVILIPISFAAIVALTVAQNPRHPNLIPVNQVMNISPTPEISTTTKIKSSDGSMELSIIKTTKQNDVNSYEMIVTDNIKTTKTTIYNDTLLSNESFTLPGNSWSNDNNKFFIEKITPYDTKYLVFKADGTSFSDGEPYLDIGQYWEKSKHTLKIKTVTGWADKDLLILYTTTTDGAEGPSFWFVISTKSFMQLAG